MDEYKPYQIYMPKCLGLCCFHEFNFSITVGENLYLEQQLYEWAVICSVFIEKGVRQVKRSEMIFFALLAGCLRCSDCDRKERPMCGCSSDRVLTSVFTFA